MQKRKKFSKKTIEKMRQAHLGYKFSLEAKKKMSLAKLGKKHTEEQKKARIECAKNNPNYGMKGKKHSEETKKKISEATIGKYVGEERYNWKGVDAKYCTKHDWIRRIFGSASNYKCKCGKQAKHWANKDHSYARKKEDYIPMCVSCHMKWDYNHNNRKTRWGTTKLIKIN